MNLGFVLDVLNAPVTVLKIFSDFFCASFICSSLNNLLKIIFPGSMTSLLKVCNEKCWFVFAKMGRS